MKYFDDIVMGGGAYGLHLAMFIKRANPERQVCVLEANQSLMARASGNNHGRLHAGYQYPLHPETVSDIARNVERFTKEYGDAVRKEGTALYGIHKDSRVSPEEYWQFCKSNNLPIKKVTKDSAIYGEDIACVYEIEELTFSNSKLKELVLAKLQNLDIKIHLNCRVNAVSKNDSGLRVQLEDGHEFIAEKVYNCTYSMINELNVASGLPPIPATLDYCTLLAVKLPAKYKAISAGVFYGPFASLVVNNEVPGSTHVLAHVSHSNLLRVHERIATNFKLSESDVRQLYVKTIADSLKILPVLSEAEYVGHISEIKSVAGSDPTIGDRQAFIANNYGGLEGYTLVFGGKMNSFYDAEKALLRE